MAEAPETTAAAGPIESIGKYELLARLGSGRNCEVFLAVRRGADRRRIVALKRLRERLTDRVGASAALLREAELASQIKHGKVVDIYEYGDEGGACYIAMEYLAGQPLGALIRRAGGLPAACVARIGADISDGLAAAHRLTDDDGKPLGLVHFDVSPSNIQVLYDGRVLLVDFGLARALSAEPGTRGKIGYLAPEQVTGPRDAPDARTDLFALGVVLWEAATGKRLYREDDRDSTLKAITDGDAPLVSSVLSDFPETLDKIIAKALARDPEERYEDGRAFAGALRSFLADSEATDTSAAISALMLEHFVKEREMADEAVANAMAVLAGERSGPTARRAATADDPEPDVPDVSGAASEGAESDYYYYEDDDSPAPAASKPDRPAAGQAASVAAAEPAAAKREASDPIDGADDDKLDAALIPSSKRSWMVAGAAAIIVLLIVVIIATSGRGDEKKTAAGPSTDEPREPGSEPGIAKAIADKPGVAAADGTAEMAARKKAAAEELSRLAAEAKAEAEAKARADDEAEAQAKLEAEADAKAKADADADAEATAKADMDAAADAKAKADADAAARAAAAAAKAKAEAEAKAEAGAAAALDAKAAKRAAAAARRRAAREKRAARAKAKAEARAQAKADARAKAKAGGADPLAVEPKKDKAAARAAYQAASRSLVTGDPAAAIRQYREALAAWPGYSPAYRGLGLANERRGNNKAAVSFYKRYLKAAPGAKDADSIRARIDRLGG